MTRTTYSDRAHAYCRRVVDREELASKWIILAAQRHLDDLDKPVTDAWEWFYDAPRVERCCSFIESLTLSNGNPFKLSDWQVWLVASLIGWVNDEGLRKYIEALILVPKGNGKSPLASALGLWFAFFDGRRQAEVYCGALSKTQAHEVFTPARNYVDSQPAFERMGITAQKTSIFSASGSRFQPVIGRGRHGARPSMAVLDELHQARTSDLYGTFKTGCNKTVNSLLLVISTAGVASVDNPCYLLQDRAQSALQGTMPDDRLFAAIYCADETVEWNSDEALRMANPNLGISNDAVKLRLAVKNAARSPAEQNNVRAMHLNQWMTASSAWLDPSEWQACYDAELTEEKVRHLPCWFGLDVALIHDLTAVVRLYRDDSRGDKPHYYVFAQCYLPEQALANRANAQLQLWSSQGLITATEGSELDLAVLRADIVAAVPTCKFQTLCYDPTFARDITQTLEVEHSIARAEIPQKSLPLTPPMLELEAAISGRRIHHDGNKVLAFCLANMKTRKYPQGNFAVPSHDRPEAKIDAGMALLFAMQQASLMRPAPVPTFKPFFI